jgi:hypothetical protein
MTAYAAATPRPPRTLMELEQATLLKVTGEHRDGFRDRVIFAVALGTGLREHEIAALDVGDVLLDDGRVGRRIALRTFKRSSAEAATQEVFIPDSLWYKLRKLVSWKRAHGESLKPAAPLFVSRRGRRISRVRGVLGTQYAIRCQLGRHPQAAWGGLGARCDNREGGTNVAVQALRVGMDLRMVSPCPPRYYYRVRACNPSGCSGYTVPKSVDVVSALTTVAEQAPPPFTPPLQQWVGTMPGTPSVAIYEAL